MKKTLLFFVFLFTLNSPVFAQGPLKIAVIDMNQILQKSPLMISMNNKLLKNFTSRQQEVNDAKKQLQDETDQLSLKGDTLSNDERTQLQNKIINDKANVAVLQASFEKDLTIAKNADLQTFMQKFSDVIQKIAKDQGYDLIEQRTTIIYLNNKLDITQQVLEKMT